MNILYCGNKQAGCVGLLTLKALGHNIVAVHTDDELTDKLARSLGLRILPQFGYCWSYNSLAELLVSVHCRNIISYDLLRSLTYGGINVHPYLYVYKGKSPIKRALEEHNTKASVGVHRMSEKLDCGEVLTEIYIDVTGQTTEEGIYNILYPYYALAIIDSMSKVTRKEV